jgi:hypothetical protein
MTMKRLDLGKLEPLKGKKPEPEFTKRLYE